MRLDWAPVEPHFLHKRIGHLLTKYHSPSLSSPSSWSSSLSSSSSLVIILFISSFSSALLPSFSLGDFLRWMKDDLMFDRHIHRLLVFHSAACLDESCKHFFALTLRLPMWTFFPLIYFVQSSIYEAVFVHPRRNFLDLYEQKVPGPGTTVFFAFMPALVTALFRFLPLLHYPCPSLHAPALFKNMIKNEVVVRKHKVSKYLYVIVMILGVFWIWFMVSFLFCSSTAAYVLSPDGFLIAK